MQFDDLKFVVNSNILGGVIGSAKISPDIVVYVRMGVDTDGKWEVHMERAGAVVKFACLPDGYALVAKPCQVNVLFDKIEEEMALDCVHE